MRRNGVQPMVASHFEGWYTHRTVGKLFYVRYIIAEDIHESTKLQCDIFIFQNSATQLTIHTHPAPLMEYSIQWIQIRFISLVRGLGGCNSTRNLSSFLREGIIRLGSSEEISH